MLTGYILCAPIQLDPDSQTLVSYNNEKNFMEGDGLAVLI